VALPDLRRVGKVGEHWDERRRIRGALKAVYLNPRGKAPIIVPVEVRGRLWVRLLIGVEVRARIVQGVAPCAETFVFRGACSLKSALTGACAVADSRSQTR
jgi:hypothetical protein